MTRTRRVLVTALAATVMTGALVAAERPAAADPKGGHGLNAGAQNLVNPTGGENPTERARMSLPKTGTSTFLIKLDTAATSTVFRRTAGQGTKAAKTAARAQRTAVRSAQAKVIAELPAKTTVVYRTQAALAAVAVRTDVKNFSRLQELAGVAAVYPIAPKSRSNSYAVPLQGAPAVWQGQDNQGQNTTIAILDTGIDYTHSNFGGPGTVAAYDAALADDDQSADPELFPTSKIIGGYDLVGDAYNADPTSADYDPTPQPDDNPLDCGGHGSHVAGTAAGLGVNADGSTYTGAYNQSTPFADLRIGPGMAPAAKIYAYKVFGCEGSTDVIGQAIEQAADPNGDGDPSDHVDVINMSLGADNGSAEDGDSIMSNAAVDLGIVVAAASGNAGDLTDIGGSPGDASKVIAVANSVDASNTWDAVRATINGSSGRYVGSRAAAYDWSDEAKDLTGTLVAPPAGNETGCAAIPAGTYTSNQVVLVDWHVAAINAGTECGSVGRGANLSTAGAGGFVVASDEEVFTTTITGSEAIPSAIVIKSAGDAMRDALAADQTVTVEGTVANGIDQLVNGDNDKVAASSSRGIHATGNVKPDVTAVGTTVFSTANGTGNEGASFTGTSMATPMVAGLAAMVKSQHPNWTPNQVKADIMNTAGQDLYVDGSADPSSPKYAPVRVGAGRIKAEAALANDVLAYNVSDAGTVSVSFGPVQATGPVKLTKTIKVENTGLSSATYAVGYSAITEVPGVVYSVSPASVSLSARSSKTITVTLTIADPKQLTKTVDPTIGRDSGIVGADGQPYARETLAEASGRVVLTPSSGSKPALRVPVYAAPRPASTMTQASTLTLPKGATQTGKLALKGTGLSSGTDADSIFSIAAGATLQVTSGLSPRCSDTVVENCYRLAEERAADLKYVGYTSDYPAYRDVATGLAYFAVSTHGAWSTPSRFEFDVYLDPDGDGFPDLVAYTTRLGEEDVFVADLVDLNTGRLVDTQLINGRFGDVDTALYDSDSMLIPVSLAALADYGVNAQHPRLGYGISTFSAYSSQPIDQAGLTADYDVTLSANVYAPGVTAVDTSNSGPLMDDQPSTTNPDTRVVVTRNLASYRADRATGLLMLHLHNTTGSKAQVVTLQNTPTVSLSVSPSKPRRGQKLSAVVKVTDPDQGSPTGAVSLVNATTGTVLAKGTLSKGSATLSYVPTTAGTLKLKAVYAGAGGYTAASSAVTTLTVGKSVAATKLSLSPKTGSTKKSTTATITVTTVSGTAASGKVTLRRTSGGAKVIGTATLKNGKATVKFTPSAKGKISYRAEYAGDSRYDQGTSSTVSYQVK